MVMLVILVVGVAAILVSVLSSSSLKIERDKTTADALAKAKAALIGYASASGNLPGSLPCPDTNDDGSAELFSGTACPSYIGRLPWKTLGIPDLRDGAGEELWYALSYPFRAQTSPAHTINSDTVGTITVRNASGNIISNGCIAYSSPNCPNPGASDAAFGTGAVAVIFAPGAVLVRQGSATPQDRSSTGTNTASNYLDIATAGGVTEDNATFTDSSSTDGFIQGPILDTSSPSISPPTILNDQLVVITHDQLLVPVEMRIAREAKQCLDNYAASNTNHRYPWAVPDTYTSQTGIYNTLFGRIAATPVTTTQSIDSTASIMLDALSSLQTVLTNYSAALPSPGATLTSALLNAGQTLVTAAQNAAYSSSFASYSSITGNADAAGDRARDLANGVSGVYVANVQNYINSTNYYLGSYNFIDNTMSITWPSSCVFTSSYWNAWQNEVFYQLASADRPGSGLANCNTSCLSITGSGNPNSGSGTYNAVVIVGRAHNASGSPTSNPPSYYLEGSNLHDSNQTYFTSPQLSQTFVTYRVNDPNYSSVNDLVLCLDGNTNCK